jgi:hypothetical protein
MRGLPAIIVVVVVIVAFIASALVVGVVHIVAESVGIVSPTLDLADTLSSETSNILRHVLDILLGIVPLVLHAVLGIVVIVLNVLGNVFDLSDLCNKLVCVRFTKSQESYLAASPSSCILRGILHAVLETVEVALSSVLVFFPVLLDFVTLVHEQCTTSKTSCSTHGSVCYVVVLLLLGLLLLLLVAAVLLALRRTLVVTASIAAAVSTSLTRVLESAFAVLLVDKEPAVLTVVPDCAPWRWDLGCALASAVALLLTAVALLLATITLLLTTVTLLGTAVIALGLLIVVVAALIVATLLAAAATLALAASELTDQIAEQTHDVKCSVR